MEFCNPECSHLWMQRETQVIVGQREYTGSMEALSTTLVQAEISEQLFGGFPGHFV